MLLLCILTWAGYASGLDITGNYSIPANSNVTFSSLDIKGGNLTIGDNSVVTVTGNVIYHYGDAGSIVLGQNVIFNISGILDFQYVTGNPFLTVGNSSAVSVTGDLKVLDGTVNVGSSAIIESTSGTLMMNTNGRININGGAVRFAVGGTGMSGGSITIDNDGSFYCGGDLTMATSATITGTSVFEVAGSLVSNAVIVVDQSSILSVSQDFTNQNSLTFSNSSVLKVYAAFSNSQSLVTDATSTVEYYGIAITGTMTVSNLALKSGGVVTLEGNLTITNSINFNNTVLKATWSSVTVQNADPNAVQYTTGFFISSSGTLSWATSADNTYFFPVGFTQGSDLRFRPVSISPVASGNTFHVRAINRPANNIRRLALDVRQANRNFHHIIYSSVSGAVADLAIYFDPTVDGGWNKVGRNSRSWSVVPGGDILSELAGTHGIYGVTATTFSVPGQNDDPSFALLSACGVALWRGSSSDISWHTLSNWVTGSVPQPCDNVIFDNSTRFGCEIMQNASAASVTFLTNSYIVRQLFTTVITVGSGGVVMSGGRFNGGGGNIVVQGDFTLNGGDFISTRGILDVTGNFTIADQVDFQHNLGRIRINSPLTGSTYTTKTIIAKAVLNDLIVQGNFQCGSSLAIFGSLEFANGNGAEVLNQGDFNVYVTKNIIWTEQRNHVQALGKLILNGSAVQQLTSQSSEVLIDNLRINKGSGIVNNEASISVTNEMDLSRGLFQNNGTLLIEATANVINASQLSYVVGPVSFINKEHFNVPVGDLTIYRPVTVNNISAPATITARYFFSTPPSASDVDFTLSGITDCEYWSLLSTASVTADVSLVWNQTSCTAFTNLDLATLAELNDQNVWSKISSGTAGNAGEGSAIGSLTIPASEKFITLGIKTYFIINTQNVFQTEFNIIGDGLPAQQYTSGVAGTDGGRVVIIPEPEDEIFPVSIEILQGARNDALNLFFDIDNAAITNVRIEMDGNLYPLSERVYTILNNSELIFSDSPLSIKNKPAISTNLQNGILFLNNGTNLFEVNLPEEFTEATLTILDNTGNILYSSDEIVLNKIGWNGKYIANSIEEVAANGTYKFQLELAGTVLHGKMILKNE